MKKKTLSVGDVDLNIISFLDYSRLIKNKKKFFSTIIRDINNIDNEDSFAGFQSEEGFKEHLNYWIYEDISNTDYPKNGISFKKCLELINEVFEKMKSVLGKKEITFYLFPTLSKFVIDKMQGSSGRVIWDNIIYIDLFPIEGWEKGFKSSLIHETAHILNDYYSDNMTIGEGIIFEGLAETFQESILRIRSPWTKSISKKKALKFFEEMKPKLYERDYGFYADVFYGKGNYPLWTGYTIGYYLLKEYLRKKKRVSWSELLRMNPEKILKESGWI